MSSITIRKLDPAVKERLRVRAAEHGMKTAYISRPYEHGAKQSRDFKAEHEFTYVAEGFEDLATQLGC